ncbi:Sortase family protein [Nonomuraea maritima]|uniref:Sortase family protein n=1 Tax=Nonomuraea maritima TaxID=683260 RepID=A0A1G9G6M3_9ACTN|nr:class F sortase [Nonomuraea maritima]SDK96237.1 Sortase family protein [Nonomuraea maritima]
MRRILAVTVLVVAIAACGDSPPSSAPSAVATDTPVAAVTPRPAVADPARIRIPAIGVDAPLVRLGLAGDGSMQTPDFGKAGWYKEGPRPGEPGPAVIAAHVDGKSGPDVFAKLGRLRKGAKIVVVDKSGQTHQFVAGKTQQSAKTALPTEEIWGETAKPALRLITCGGTFDRASGHYDSNVIVWADSV